MKCFTDFRHRVDVAGRAGDGLRQHAALSVEHTPAERSPHSRTIGENAVRISTCACSSHHRDQAVPR